MQIGLGTASFGTSIDAPSAFKILDAFMAHGGTIIDTANNYAFWNGVGGESEVVIGEWLKGVARPSVEIHTKIGAQPVDRRDLDAFEGLSATSIERAIAQSLRRLDTDYIDVLYAHVDDPGTPLLETWSAFTAAVTSGVVRKLGISNYPAERIAELSEVISTHDLAPVRYAQYRHTLIPPVATASFGVQICYSEEVKQALTLLGSPLVVGYSPLLDGAFETGGKLPENYRTEDNELELSRIRRAAEQCGVSPSAWVLKRIAEQGVLPLTMTGKVDRLMGNLALFRAEGVGG